MTRSSPVPPPVLDSARVIEYAVLDKSVIYSGHSSLFVDGRELGPVPCLAVCQPLEGASFLLFHCDTDWTVLGAAEYPSVAEAKIRAERIYRGISGRWIDAHVTEQQVKRYLDEVWSDQRCSVCGRRPDQVEHLITKNNIHICDSCIREFYEMLHDGS